MGWSIGYSEQHQRDIGYGVPAICDHPDCNAEIDRGVSHLCGFNSDTGDGCGLHFCSAHLSHRYVLPAEGEDEDALDDDEGADRGPLCDACANHQPTYPKKPDHPDWINWKLTDESWATWRAENPAAVEAMKNALKGATP